MSDIAGGKTMGVDFERENYQFLKELSLAPENLGCYGGGVWRANGPTVTSVNPSDNEVNSSRVSDPTCSFFAFVYKST